MRAPISVIIPTLNAGKDLPSCLMALGEGLQAGLLRELIVTDGGSTDETRNVAQAAGAEIVTGQPGRGDQLRRGADRAGGAWLMIVHADTMLAEGWSEAVLEHLATEDPAAFCLRLRSRHPMARITERWANLRSRLFNLPYGDQGLLLPRALYDRAGGYPAQPMMEDVALVRALKTSITLLPANAETSAARYRRDGWLRRGVLNLVTLLRYLSGAAPDSLARSDDKTAPKGPSSVS